MRDGGAYGCAVPRAYANLNPGLVGLLSFSSFYIQRVNYREIPQAGSNLRLPMGAAKLRGVQLQGGFAPLTP